MRLFYHLKRPKLTFTKLLKQYSAFNSSNGFRQLIRKKFRKLCVDDELETKTNYGFRMFVAPSDYASYGIYFFGEYDFDMSQIFMYYIKEGDTVFDLGTERGWFSLLMGRLVGNKGEVFSFEAFTPNYEKLKKNIELNNMNWIIPNNIGLSRKRGKMWFVPPSDEITNNISFLNGCGGIGYLTDKYAEENIEVPVISIDEYVIEKRISKISFIKIDIEGEEYNTLLGAKTTLQKFRPIMAIEYNRPTALRAGNSVEELDALLESYNYDRYYFNNGFHNFNLTNFEDSELVINIYCFPN